MCRTRYGRISKLYDFARHFLETANYQDAEEEGKWIKLYYFDDAKMKEKLSDGIHYQSSYFSSDANIEKIDSKVCDEKAK